MNTNNDTMTLPQRDKRSFFPEDFITTTWSEVEPYIKNLLEREINSKEDLKKLLLDNSEF